MQMERIWERFVSPSVEASIECRDSEQKQRTCQRSKEGAEVNRQE